MLSPRIGLVVLVRKVELGLLAPFALSEDYPKYTKSATIMILTMPGSDTKIIHFHRKFIEIKFKVGAAAGQRRCH